jgi:CRISPR/Cas system-associated exonuclease Cas4 (RecB family)
MLINWYNHFLVEFSSKFNGSVAETFNLVKPETEREYVSEKYSVRGFIDAIKEVDGKVQIIDYKTNNSPEIKDSIRIQLGIYSLLYLEKHRKLPDKLGVFFLKDKMHPLDVDDSLIRNAINAIERVHSLTSISEKKEDYSQKTSGLCRWAMGQCDFYDECRPFD